MKVTWHSLETVAWILFYSGVLAFVFGHSNALSEYRRVFIERSQTYPETEQTTAYEPGAVILGTLRAPYFQDGWWPAGDDAIVSRDATAVVQLTPTDDIAAGSRLRFRLNTLTGRGLRAQPVTVLVDGALVGTVEANGAPSDYDLPLPQATRAGGTMRISLSLPRLYTPLQLHINHDTRGLGIWLYEIAVVPKP